MREYLNLPTARRALGALCLAVLLAGCNRDVLDPAGDIALQQRDIIYISTALMLLIIVPVMALTIVFAWRYRESNKEATYDPDFETTVEVRFTPDGDYTIVDFEHRDLERFGDKAAEMRGDYDTIRSAEPLGGGVTMRYPESVRRRFEKLRRHPAGFLAFGDAICSFNPVYGQGMSVAALQARVLHNVLSSNAGLSAERFYRAASTVIDTPWSIAAGGDLRMPEFRGKRPLGKRLLNWYISRLHRFAHHDPGAAVTFLRVAQLIDPPSVLLSPKLALRALTASKGGPRYSRNSGLKAPAAAERG